jgi:hypothetical protein
MLEMFSQQHDAAKAEASELRTIEADLRNAYSSEEARWLDLIGRLEESIRREGS